MTACVNRKHTKKVAAVVTASLVGALSLGVAPVAAMAEDTGIETLATDDQDFSKGAVEWRSGKPGDKFAYTGLYTGLVPKTITTVSGQEFDLELADQMFNHSEPTDHAYYLYAKIGTDVNVSQYGIDYRDVNGNIEDLKGEWVVDDDGHPTRPTEPGTYAVVIFNRIENPITNAFIDSYKTAIADTFTINNPSFKDALIYDGEDQTDTTFEYTGKNDSAQVGAWKDRLNVSLYGEKLDKHYDYDIEIWKKGGAAELADNATLETGTTYIIKIKGQGVFDGTAEQEFTFGKLDLSKAAVSGAILDKDNEADLTKVPTKDLDKNTAVVSINGILWNDPTDLNELSQTARDEVEIEFVGDPDGNQTFNKKQGVYTYRISATADAKYVQGSTTFTVVYARNIVNVDLTGCADANPDGNGLLVDLSKDTNHFDIADAVFTDADTDTVLDLDDDEYTMTVVKQDGTAATAEDLKKPGTYYVKVDVNFTKGGELTAGSSVIKVVVSYEGINQTNDIFFSYDNNNVVAETSDTYNGKNFIEKMAVSVVTDGGTTLAQGTDYTVTYYKVNDDDSRTAVEQIVDAGEYVVVVKGITFDESCEFYFDVDKATPEIRVNYDLVTDEETGDGVYNYTGEAITPTFTFLGVDGQPLELTADDYTVDYTYYVDEDLKNGTDDVNEVKAAGFYTAEIKLADTVANYAYDATARYHADPSIEIEVSTAGVFADVPTSGQWYSQVVYDATELGYMNGYAGTKLFGPNDSITRGQVACVLYNMSGADVDESGSAAYNELFGWDTGFSDVDGKAYYAKAIYWAKSTGVVNGYGDGTFAPDAQITREEFAAMLSNYAENMGDDVEGAEADLSAFGDASQVSDWATEAIEWAVANEVMGNGGFLAPTANITRAEAAAMAVNYQPERPSTIQ
ncbi:S-layer homology domain-containing protein [Collinsella tanakaei]|nr:S-layer homology domain-containing protein [Collinsella tanakaei]